MKVKVDPGAYYPTRHYPTDAGMDIRSPKAETIEGHGSVSIHTGVHIQLPKGKAGLLVSKSGLMMKNGITSTGLIDEGYTGEIVITLFNHSDVPFCVDQGQKISQLIIISVDYEPVEIVEEIQGNERGNAGFGSTGKY